MMLILSILYRPQFRQSPIELSFDRRFIPTYPFEICLIRQKPRRARQHVPKPDDFNEIFCQFDFARRDLGKGGREIQTYGSDLGVIPALGLEYLNRFG